MGSGVSSLGVDEEKLKYFLARRSDRRPVRNLCPVQEALTGGLDETAPARERKLEATSDLVHGDERNRESLDFLRLWLKLLLDVLDLDRLARDIALTVAIPILFIVTLFI